MRTHKTTLTAYDDGPGNSSLAEVLRHHLCRLLPPRHHYIA
ncbi:hypothetical protein AB0P15_32765 [Streptomyces sp. NPDC087917]